ncbi:MAG: transcription antitermination factor NusB [Candidatus Lloydbacteria bacterium RIFCSPHIGHO2_01_FULL_49_22]|uniref:Transcription antitermination protein NusB n=1 Tax=Candidatus Lloydbacteria bacterium RIFCSPHIGHO2_01_FULL_49_22 TaxID=1798658 RepID=A0A1G2CYZ5_9BACT|nr:MAG: transcription antitermination factor NusB [Candidatus Lloydbacteria bacterium RIFCSPHIGHO2_01_FULL_49_22]OGZ09053.1 MAG: transcription antitermination factor NusB [Candidatus Lloydbacteria bacterium RIFCSPHIGHO2_02_FULL_50_18]
MANRHLSRSIVLQSLFEWDFNDHKIGDVEAVLERNIEEFAPGLNDATFMADLLRNILAKQPELDLIIEKAAPAWPIERISVVDRNVLRMGLYELLFGDRNEVPPKVAINEAIELAKTFGGENSGKFVNGVLGAVYKEIGEPGKDETTQSRDKKNQLIDPATLPLEQLGGAVVYGRDQNGDLYLALVHDIFGHWTLSKGHIEDGENPEQGTIREIKEEMNANIVIVEKLGENEYIASHPEKGKIRKHVSYFLGEAPFQPLELEEGKGGLDDARWFKAAELVDLNIYDDILPIITKAITSLMQQKA